MLSVNLICVGKIKEKYILDGMKEYAKRLQSYVDFKIVELKEIGNDKKRQVSIEKESAEIQHTLTKLGKAHTVLLDIKGKQYTSELYADEIVKIQLNGISTINFIIGGSYGVSDELKKQVDSKLSFSEFTFPHQLMRFVFMEQLYRWISIINNSKYHK